MRGVPEWWRRSRDSANRLRGQPPAIALDAIAYEHDGKKTWIEIGSDLTGKFAAASTPAYGGSTASASATTGPTSLPANVDLNDPSLSAEQRMRLRRQLLERGGGR